MKAVWICPICEKKATSSTFACVGCRLWVHVKCSGFTYKQLRQVDPKQLFCSNCKKDFKPTDKVKKALSKRSSAKKVKCISKNIDPIESNGKAEIHPSLAEKNGSNGDKVQSVHSNLIAKLGFSNNENNGPKYNEDVTAKLNTSVTEIPEFSDNSDEEDEMNKSLREIPDYGKLEFGEIEINSRSKSWS